MGVGLSSMQQITGALTGAALTATKLSGDFSKEAKIPGVDERMALTSRQRTAQKIKAIQMNKEISDKAKSRRIGKALDEYRADLEKAGGKK